MFRHLIQFNHIAIAQALPASAILLWQTLYTDLQQRQCKIDVCYDSCQLQSRLQLSRKGLYNARKALIQANVLSVREEKQKLFYTLLLNGDTVSFAAVSPSNANIEPHSISEAAQQAAANPVRTAPAQEILSECFAARTPSLPDKETLLQWKPLELSAAEKAAQKAQQQEKVLYRPLGESQYRQYFQQFRQSYPDGELIAVLEQWAQMRMDHGWKLTLWGLEALLDKLVQLACGEISTMIALVRQSLERRWKGFHPLSLVMQPSGTALLRKEAEEQKFTTRTNRFSITNRPKFQPEKRDLSFLEY